MSAHAELAHLLLTGGLVSLWQDAATSWASDVAYTPVQHSKWSIFNTSHFSWPRVSFIDSSLTACWQNIYSLLMNTFAEISKQRKLEALHRECELPNIKYV
jgi:hypothetical protein